MTGAEKLKDLLGNQERSDWFWLEDIHSMEDLQFFENLLLGFSAELVAQQKGFSEILKEYEPKIVEAAKKLTKPVTPDVKGALKELVPSYIDNDSVWIWRDGFLRALGWRESIDDSELNQGILEESGFSYEESDGCYRKETDDYIISVSLYKTRPEIYVYNRKSDIGSILTSGKTGALTIGELLETLKTCGIKI